MSSYLHPLFAHYHYHFDFPLLYYDLHDSLPVNYLHPFLIFLIASQSKHQSAQSELSLSMVEASDSTDSTSESTPTSSLSLLNRRSYPDFSPPEYKSKLALDD